MNETNKTNNIDNIDFYCQCEKCANKNICKLIQVKNEITNMLNEIYTSKLNVNKDSSPFKLMLTCKYNR